MLLAYSALTYLKIATNNRKTATNNRKKRWNGHLYHNFFINIFLKGLSLLSDYPTT